MKKQNIGKLILCMGLPLLLAAGCTHSRDGGRYHTLSPTSDSQIERIYQGDPGFGGAITRTEAPEGATTGDWDLGQAVRAALTADKESVGYPSQVAVAVDKDTEGLVRLSGTVGSERERRRLVDRISQIPGVTRVDDQLKVSWSDQPAEVDLRVPVGSLND